MSDKISFILCKDEKMVREMLDFIKSREEITKREMYLRFSRRHADYFWKFLHFINDRVSDDINNINEEIADLDNAVKSLFLFHRARSRNSNKDILQVRRNYTINTFQIGDISGFEVVLRE